MTIRPAQPRDLDRVLELLAQVLELHARLRPDVFVPSTTKYSRAELTDLIADPATPVFVAADAADRVVGYVFCQWRRQAGRANMVPEESLYIDDLCVDEACRSQGVGKALFAHVTALARARGCRRVDLTVWEGNAAARRFYEACGMRPRSTCMEILL